MTLQEAIQLQQAHDIIAHKLEEEDEGVDAVLNFRIVSNADKLQEPIENARESMKAYDEEEKREEKHRELLQEEVNLDLHELELEKLPNTKPSVIAALMPIIKQ